MTFEIKRERKCMLSGGAWGKRAVYCELHGWPGSFSLLCVAVLNSAYSPLVIPHHAPQCPNNSKSLGERAGPAVSQHSIDFNQNTLDVTSHPCFFIPSKQKAAPGTAFTKDSGSRQGCVGTAVNPRHVCSMRNTRHKAYWIKGLPD